MIHNNRTNRMPSAGDEDIINYFLKVSDQDCSVAIMPYGCAMFSKFGGPPVFLKSEDVRVTANNIRYIPSFIQGDARCYLPTKRLRSETIGKMSLILFYTEYMMDVLSERCGATPAQLQAVEYGLAVGYCGRILQDETVSVTHVLLVPDTIALLSVGRNPPGVDTSQLPVLKALGVLYPVRHNVLQPIGFALQPAGFGAGLCVVCAEFPPQYAWEGCKHPYGGGYKLVCHKCCNILRRQVAGNSSIRGIGYITMPCFLCRKPSRVTDLLAN